MTKLADLKKRWMADSAFRSAYEKADAEYRLAEALEKTGGAVRKP